MAALQALTFVYGPLPPPAHPAVADWTPTPLKGGHRGRYAWTDAFGAVALVSAGRADLAARVLAAVRDTLCRTRDGGARLPGASDARPWAGGVRIGKHAPPGEADGDGMYLHYATKVAFALATLARARPAEAAAWGGAAVDVLAAVADAALDGGGGAGAPFFHWKIGVAITDPKPRRPAVGGLDAADLAVTARIVARVVAGGGGDGGGAPPPIPPPLARSVAAADAVVAARLASPRSLVSADPLDAGCALVLARWGQAVGGVPWADRLASDAERTAASLWRSGAFAAPAATRLPFREFGLTLGVQVAGGRVAREWRERVDAVHAFWGGGRARLTRHDADISPLMFAASLAPGAWRPEWEPDEQ